MASTVKRRSPNALAELRRATNELASLSVVTGWSRAMGASGESIKKAAINTLGAPDANIPARDALTPTMVASEGRIRDRQTAALIAAFRGQDPRAELEALAAELQTELRRQIDAFTTPPNAPSTIAHKGANDPLVETGTMRDEAASRVFKR